MRACVVGAGGREHALADALARTAEVVVTPGNAGMAALADGRFSVRNADPAAIDADLFVIGPEAPLVDGLADRLRATGRLVLGPGADGARLEGSKAWMKDLLADAGVPTAAHAAFDRVGPALEHLRSLPGPWVVKTDGLAAGKGVLVTDDLDLAERDVRAKLDGSAFGRAGTTVVVEEHLDGLELSVMALCDGTRAVALATARDHKRLGDGDAGPMTGGVGAYSPVPGAGPDVVDAVMTGAVEPTLDALSERGVDYRGVLYAGVMLTASGPRILEFNVRFGDPETQVVLPRWRGDVAAVLAAAASGHLDEAEAPEWSTDAAVTVVLSAAGYPAAPRAGDRVEGLADATATGARVYAAGVGAGGDRGLVTAGGRVLAVTGLGPDLAAASDRAYDAAGRIRFAGRQMRHDIARAPAARTTADPTPGGASP